MEMNVLVAKLFKESAYSMQFFGRKDVHQNKLVSFMMSLIRFGLTKDEIRKCSLRSFNGRVYVIDSENDQYKRKNQIAINSIRNSSVIGFDTESKVDFSKIGSNHSPISLMQLANEDIVILWRLRKEGKFLHKQFPDALRDILTSNTVLKVGTGNNNDNINLYKEYNVVIKNTVDTQHIAKKLGFLKIGLESLTAQLFNWKISKARSKRLSNWEARKLNFDQVIYAATDAWASLLVYKKLHSLERTLYSYDELYKKISTFGKSLFAEKDIDHQLFKLIDKKVFKKTMDYDSFGAFIQKKHTKINYTLDDIDAEYLLQIINPSDTKKDLGILKKSREFDDNCYFLYAGNVQLSNVNLLNVNS